MTIVRQPYSEIALGVALIALLSLVRIYYGGGHGIMVVWKGQPTFQDTLVNLSEVTQMPPEQLRREHPSVHWQLVAMEIIEDNIELQSVRERLHWKRLGPAKQAPDHAPSPGGNGS